MTEHAWKATVFAGLSVDGFIARADGDLDWLTALPELPHSPAQPHPDVPDFGSLLAASDHMVMGRVTFQTVLGMGLWPYGSVQVIVLSTSLEGPQPHGAIVARGVREVASLLDSRGARRVYVDGGRTVQSFLSAGLAHDVVVNHVPVLIGTGIPLFGALPADVHLIHQATAVSATGMVSSRYQVLHSATGSAGPTP